MKKILSLLILACAIPFLAQAQVSVVNGRKVLTNPPTHQAVVENPTSIIIDLSNGAKGTSMVTLKADNVFGDGTGYQMLIDADATAFGSAIPATGLLCDGDAPAGLYNQFEYKIPVNADGALNTSNFVTDGNSITIIIPSGTYDFAIVNPTPTFGGMILVANEPNSREDDFVFENNKHYLFHAKLNGGYDMVSLTISDFNSSLAEAPSGFTVSPVSSLMMAFIRWTNPTHTLAGAPLTAISKVVLQRDGVTINEYSPTAVGEYMEIIDTQVPSAGLHEYTVYAVTSEGNGAIATQTGLFGETCLLRIEMQDAYEMGIGWFGGKLNVKHADKIIGSATLRAGFLIDTVWIMCPVGQIQLEWIEGQFDDLCAFQIYDTDDRLIYTTSDTPTAGILYTFQHSCSGSNPCDPVTNLTGTFDQAANEVNLSWTAPANSEFTGYEIFCVGMPIGTAAASATTFTIDASDFMGELDFCVVAIYPACQSDEVCVDVNVTFAVCDPVTNLSGMFDQAANEVILSWTAPTNSEFTGYEIFCVGMPMGNAAASATTFTLDASDFMGELDFCVVAIYPTCQSNEVCVDVNVLLGIDIYSTFSLYPNPANRIINIEAESIQSITIHNAIGQVVAKYGNISTVDVSSFNTGIYFFSVTTTEGKTERVKVIVNR